VTEPSAVSVPMRASILIKANDQREELTLTFSVLARQTVSDFQVILLYSGEEEPPLLPAHLTGQLVRIKPHHFSHPGALNIGAGMSTGEYLVCFSADAVPKDETWLERLLEPFDCPHVAGVFGRHLFRPEGNYADRFKLRVRYPARPACRWGQGRHIFSNVNSAIRRDLWEIHRFDETLPGCEDYEWARWAHGSGFATVYAVAPAVFHTHGQRDGYILYFYRYLNFARLRRSINRRYDIPTFPKHSPRPCLVTSGKDPSCPLLLV